jgi:ABC transporter substrate binding protein
MIERRAFLGTVGLALLAGQRDTAAQTTRTHRLGFLGGATAEGYASLVEALLLGLRDHGYVVGQNLAIEYRWADGDYERLSALAAELVRLKVHVIVTQGTPAAFAAKRATSTVPIVMAIVGNPVESGIVASYARPGGNVTGSSFFWGDLNAKRLEFLKTLNPGLARGGVLINPDNPAMAEVLRTRGARPGAEGERPAVNVRRLDELAGAFQLAASRPTR